MSRLKRKDIKRDEVLESLGRTISFTRHHMRGLLGIVAAAVVAALLVALFFVYRGRQSDRANQLLAEALQIYNAPIDAVSPRPDDDADPTFVDELSRNARAKEAFEELYANSKGAPLGAVAAAYLGDLAAVAGDLDIAEQMWREALVASDGSLLAGRVQMSLINLVKGRDREAAIAELRGLLSVQDGALPEDVILYELAGALEDAGRTEEARSTYARLVEEHETSVHNQDARQKLDEF